MKFTVPMTITLAGTALAQNSTLTTSTTAYPSTTIVSALTTVCVAATVLTQNGNYYTCTEAMTLTITDCPCTMTHVRPCSPPSPPLPLSIPKLKLTVSQPSYTTYATAPTTTASVSTSTIIIPAFCPITTAASTLAQNAGYTPTCQAVGPAAAGYTPSSQGQAKGTAMLPSSTQYAYTNSCPGGVAAGGAGAVLLAAAGALCALML